MTRTVTLLIWEEFPAETRFFIVGSDHPHHAEVVAAAGQHVDMTVEDDGARRLEAIIEADQLDTCEVEHEGMIEGFTFNRVVIAGTAL